MDYTLGSDRDYIAFDSAQTARELALAMVSQGRRSALLCTRKLDPQLYDNIAFGDALSRLLRTTPRSFCQVLVQETEDLSSRDHRLISIAQNLSSYIEIRLVADDHVDEMQTFMVVDDCGIVQRPNSAIFTGKACFNDPREARDLSRWFDTLWQQSSVLSSLRQLHI